MTTTPEPLFEHLDVLDDRPPHGAALNMALDEVLLGGLGGRPLLRVYRWERPAVSFGYFEPYEAVARLFPGRELVRRWTGGGTVEHGADWTYSLLVPRSHPVTNLRAGKSYRLVHHALREAFVRLGWGAPVLAEGSSASSQAAVRACFVQPVEHDLLQDGRKLGGAAQRRTRAGLLHQGSVQRTGSDPAGLERLAAILPRVLAIRWRARGLQPGELARAHALAADRYAAPAWLRRR